MRTPQAHRANQQQRDSSNSGLQDSRSDLSPVHLLRAGRWSCGKEGGFSYSPKPFKEGRRVHFHSAVLAVLSMGRATDGGTGPSNPRGGCPEPDPKIRTGWFGPCALTGEGMMCAGAEHQLGPQAPTASAPTAPAGRCQQRLRHALGDAPASIPWGREKEASKLVLQKLPLASPQTLP